MSNSGQQADSKPGQEVGWPIRECMSVIDYIFVYSIVWVLQISWAIATAELKHIRNTFSRSKQDGTHTLVDEDDSS